MFLRQLPTLALAIVPFAAASPGRVQGPAPQAAIAPQVAASVALPVQVADPPSQACAELRQLTRDEVAFPGSVHYSKENHRYWSQAAALKPRCIVFPTNAATVSVTMQVLNKYKSVPFAIKSGGHNGNPGFSGVDNGILIAMSRLASLSYNPATHVADVGPGMRWSGAIKALEPAGRTLVGGRVGDVGAGGYLVQGGLSYLSSQYGLACSSVVEYELVTANGTITRVTATTHPDLFFALKGGGNQFGVVTNFKIQTYPIGKVWAGFKMVSPKATKEYFAALRSYAENADPKSAIISILATGVKGHGIALAMFYDGPTPPPSAWGALSAIPGKVIGKSVSYSTALISLSKANNLDHVSIAMEEITLPVLPSPYGERLFTRVYDRFTDVHKALKKMKVMEVNMAFQPLQSSTLQETAKRGRTAIGVDPNSGPRLFIEMDVIYVGNKPSPQINAVLAQYRSEISQFIQEEHTAYAAAAKASNKVVLADVPLYLPTFMNDAGSIQNVTGSYSAYEELGQIQRKWDPEGVFSTRTGGWRF